MAAERAVRTLLKIDWQSETLPEKDSTTQDLTLTSSELVKNNLGLSKPLLIFVETHRTKKQSKSKRKSKKSKKLKLTSQAALSAKIVQKVFESNKWDPQIAAMYFQCIKCDATEIDFEAGHKFFNTKTAPLIYLIDEKGVISGKFKSLSSSRLIGAMSKMMLKYGTDLKKTIKRVKKHLQLLFDTEKKLYICGVSIARLKKKKNKSAGIQKKLKTLEKQELALNDLKYKFIEKYRAEIKPIKLLAGK